MSLAVLKSRALAGMEAPAVQVAVHLVKGWPAFAIVVSKTAIIWAKEQSERPSVAT